MTIRTRAAVAVLVPLAAVGLLAGPAAAAKPKPRPALLSTVSAMLGALQTDNLNIGTAAQASNTVALAASCSSEEADAKSFLSLHRPKAWPKQGWTLLQQAMAQFAYAGHECAYGATNVDVNALQQSLDAMSTGTSLLKQATVLFKAANP